MSVQNLYAHKRQFYYSLGYGTHADEGLLYLARQGTKSIEFLADNPPSQIEDKKTLFWLSDIDDVITGQLYQDPPSSTLDTKIFRIWISHRKHFYHPPEKAILDNDIFIYAAEKGPVIAHFGKRAVSLQMSLAPLLHWDYLAPFKGFETQKENQSWVEAVEKEKWAGSESFFKDHPKRLFDRAILVWKNLDASALRELLIRDHQINPDHVESVSLSRWNETKLITQFAKRGIADDIFRGTLLLSSQLSTDSALKIKIEATVESLNKMSTF
jgi:hypothetical protein